MAEITPFNPTSPSIPTGSFIPRSGTLPITPPNVDNMSAYSKDITDGNSLTIIGFSKAIISATNQMNDTTWQVQQFNASSRNEMYHASVEEVLALLQLYDRISEVTSSYSNASKANQSGISNVNNRINNYNSKVGSDNSQVQTLNNAINDYNAKKINLSQLQAAVNTYNAYASSQNASASLTNTAINNYNTQLLIRNQSLSSQYQYLIDNGVSPSLIAELNLPGTYNGIAAALPIIAIPSSPPMNNVSYSGTLLTPLTNTMNAKGQDNGIELASEMFAPFFALLGGQLALTAQLLNDQSSYQSFIQFFFNNVPYLSASFYQPTPDIKMGSSGSSGGSGSGVSLATLITSLSSPMMEAILSQGKFTEAYGQSIQGPAPQVINEALYLGLALLSHIGLQAGSPALRLLEGRLPFIDIRSSPVAAVLGLKLAGEAVKAVSSDALLNGVKEILSKSFPNLDATSLTALAQKLASAVELFVLQASLLQLAQVLKIPDLLNLVFSTLDNAKTLKLNSQSAEDIFKANGNILKESALKEAIIKNIANGTNISREILNHIIDAAVVSRDLTNSTNLSRSILNELIGNDVAKATNILKDVFNQAINNDLGKIANISKDILSQAINNGVVNTGIISADTFNRAIINDVINSLNITKDILTQSINNAIVDGDYNQAAVINTLVQNGITKKEAINAESMIQNYLKSEVVGRDILDQSVVTNRLNQSILANEAVNKIVTDHPNITNRELRDRLILEFVANGATQQDAIASATFAVTGKFINSPSVESLPAFLFAKGLSETAGIGLNSYQTQAFANELVSTVLGPSISGSQASIRELMNLKLTTLIEGEDSKTIEKVKQNFEQFLAPVIELSVFAQQLLDPANTFIGIMYDRPQPTNFKKSVDIAV